MHIGIICNEYPPCKHGGIGSFTKDLAEGLVNVGYNVTVVGYYQENVLNLSRDIEEFLNGVRVLRLPFARKSRNKSISALLCRLSLYQTLRSLHRINAFDVIESPECSGWLPLGTPNRIPLITRLHGGETYFDSELSRRTSRLVRILEKYQLKHSDQITSVSEYTARVTFDLFGLNQPYKVIYNSFKIPSEYLNVESYKEEKNCIVFTGSVIPKKGVAELVKAMNIVLLQFPNTELIIAGKNQYQIDGTPFDEVMLSTLENEEYKSQIKFLGAVDRDKELFPLIESATVCCFPSYSESFGLAPLEAMAFGKPVVFTKLASGPEVIEDEVSGLLCDPHDPKDIAKKIIKLLSNKALRETIAENGKSRAFELFNFDKWMDDNIQLYEEIKEKRGKH